jgi:hypothetical protein
VIIMTPHGFLLCGKPREILRQLHLLRQGCYYVHQLLDRYFPGRELPGRDLPGR